MKVLLIFKFILVLNFTFGQSNSSCEKFKTGKFELVNPDGTRSVIIRTKHEQIEKSGDIELTHKVQWVGPRIFKLYPKKIKDDTNLVGTDVVTFRIIECLDHAYIAEVTIDGDTDFILHVKVYEYGFLNYDK